MKRQAGFTLIELLLVLTIVLILSGLAIPSMINAIEEVETKQFLQELDSDVLYAQSHSLGESDYIRIFFEATHYRMMNTKTGTTITRDYPANLTHSNVRIITFSRHGTVKGSTSIILSNDKRKYLIVFPIGKGRHYIEEL